MGCSSNPQVENKNIGIEDYDERDNFYYFHIQRKNKKPLPPSKYSPEKDYNFDRNDERIGTINDEENKNSKNNDDSQYDEDTSEKRNKGDLYRNKNNNNNSSNGDINEDSLNGKKMAQIRSQKIKMVIKMKTKKILMKKIKKIRKIGKIGKIEIKMEIMIVMIVMMMKMEKEMKMKMIIHMEIWIIIKIYLVKKEKRFLNIN